MKPLLLAATAAVFTAAVNLTPASAADPRATAGNPQAAIRQNVAPAIADTAAVIPHYEWQYHYVGHHPRYVGHWVLVR